MTILCDFCNMPFDTLENLEAHQWKRHPVGMNYFAEAEKTEADIQKDKEVLKSFLYSMKEIAEELDIGFYPGIYEESAFFFVGRWKSPVSVRETIPYNLDMLEEM